MKYMFTWKLAPQFQEAAAKGFLESGAPMPEGVTCIGRWHVPGSSRGWLLVETDNLEALSEHAVEWGKYLEIEVLPVVDDDVAGSAMAKVYGS